MDNLDQSMDINNKSFIGRILKDPLFQFFIIGAVLFATFQIFSDPVVEASNNRILIDNQTINTLSASFERSWLRKPTKIELDGLIQDHVKGEVLYREALKLGMDKNDPVIRRRLRQKMEFLNQDLIQLPEPTDEILQAYLDNNKEEFKTPAKATFTQVYFKFKKSENTGDRINIELEKLKSLSPKDATLGSFGDRTMLPGSMNNSTPYQIGRIFGQDFAENLVLLPVNKWTGPMKSGFGLHLLYINEIIPSAPANLTEVRQKVEREWRDQQLKENNRLVFQAIKSQYEVEFIDTNQGKP